VKFVSWAKKRETVLITSPANDPYKPLVKNVDDIRLIGRVVWSWREHK
jgi:hypothetical protein